MIATIATQTETASSAGSATSIRSRAIHHATSSAISPEKKAELAVAAAFPKSTSAIGVRDSTTCWSVPPNSSPDSDQPIWKSERLEVVQQHDADHDVGRDDRVVALRDDPGEDGDLRDVPDVEQRILERRGHLRPLLRPGPGNRPGVVHGCLQPGHQAESRPRVSGGVGTGRGVEQGRAIGGERASRGRARRQRYVRHPSHQGPAQRRLRAPARWRVSVNRSRQ